MNPSCPGALDDGTPAADGTYTVASLRAGESGSPSTTPGVRIREWYDDVTSISAADDVTVAAGATVAGIDADVVATTP